MLGPMPPAVRVRADFESVYPGASREATECAMNLVKTGDMVVSRVAAILRGFGPEPRGWTRPEHACRRTGAPLAG